MPKELGIRKGDTWAFREGTRYPLVPVVVMNQPAHYQASITIRILDSPERGLMSVRRVRLPCKWDRVEEYLYERPDIPREYVPLPDRGPFDLERDAIDTAAADPLSLGEATIRRIIREELEGVVGVPRISLNYRDAAYATGYSATALRLAVQQNELIPSYANSKPVFTIAELQRWVESLPTEKP